MTEWFKYWFTGHDASKLGTDLNLNTIKGIEEIELNKVPEKGPFDKALENVEKVKVTELWREQTVVIHLMRRFGCKLCRIGALELSSLKPILDNHGVKMVAVGLGYNSLDGFMEGKYWDGLDLYIDEKKSLYDILKLGKRSIFGLLDKGVNILRKEANSKNIDGNLKGDGLSLGGTYVIAPDGKILMEFQQSTFADHVALSEILKALNIPESELEGIKKVDTSGMVCTDEVCELPKKV